MFQALQTGALDAGEFIGPWTDSALGYYQVAPYYYWPGVGEPSSAEECGVNAEAYAELPDDLQRGDRAGLPGALQWPVWTEYMTKHAQSLKTLVSEHNVQVRKLPDDVIAAMGCRGRRRSCRNTWPTTTSW
jgi:TRAP-type mannitol/chloroaromatic compound transport system substrate-binding protein